jgi:hypothetical protein
LLKGNIRLFVDGTSKSFSYDASTDRLSFTPKSKLSLGKHTAKIVAKDAAGAVGTRSWSFSVVR